MTDADHIVINGVNSRLDELQAAILRVKLKHLNEMNQKRNETAAIYRKLLRKDLFEHQRIDGDVYCNYHVYALRCKGDRSKFTEYLNRKNIQANIYYTVPLHLQKANQFLGYKEGDLPETEKLCKSATALPLYPEIPDKTLEYVIETVNKFKG